VVSAPQTAERRTRVAVIVIGVAFGFALSRAGFTSWDEVHAMFTFESFRLTGGFALALPLLALSFWLIARATRARWPRRELHPGTLPGAALFGLGWSLCGACPSIALVQLGEGQLGALATLVGIFVGNWGYAAAHERWFRWSQASCAAD
jgi:uncharacterized membrane protein YedE/YeeE